MSLGPDELRREIDDTLAELDRLEAEVVELFGELLGPAAARHVAAYMRAKERDAQTSALRGPSSRDRFSTEVLPGPWTAPPATP